MNGLLEDESTPSEAMKSSIAQRVLLLSPSSGLGGGVERYVAALEWAFRDEKIGCECLALERAGPAAHLHMLASARARLRQVAAPTRLVVAHPALLPVAWLLAREPTVTGVSVVCHGIEVWGSGFRPRRYIERRLLRTSTTKVVAASNFTAGTLSRYCPVTVLPPGLPGDWFMTIVNSAASGTVRRPGYHLTTAFRLAAWREKGLPEILTAVAALGRRDVRLTVCGCGRTPQDLLDVTRRFSFCSVRAQLTDAELARNLADADLFVLATRTNVRRGNSGEGFGLALLEAQIAGTPVVPPAHGGSADAYLDGITGVAPVDESAEALADVLAHLLEHPGRLQDMGHHAALWARASFNPQRYARLAVSKLLLNFHFLYACSSTGCAIRVPLGA